MLCLPLISRLPLSVRVNTASPSSYVPGQQLKPRTFNKLYDRISRVQQVTTRDSQGARRAVWLRYRRWYPAENNDWGEFQSHRRVLGLITLGKSIVSQRRAPASLLQDVNR